MPTVTDDEGAWSEPMARRVARRLVSIPGLLVITGVYVALLPVLIAIAAAVDVARRRPLLAVRFHVGAAFLLIWHVVGVGLLFVWWLAGLRWLGLKPRRWREWNRSLEGWWGNAVVAGTEFIYGSRMEISGDELLTPGPIVVFSKHTGILDTMLPLRILEHRHAMTARIVKKRELLWDPCVDIVSYRLPRTFVRRGSSDREQELRLLRKVASGMGPRDGLWVFPEGTRFTAEKRRRVIEKLRQSSPEGAARAEELTSTLPIRLAGALALLERCRGMDVVFCAHTGFEGANRVGDFLAGLFYHRTVKVQFWRVPAAQVPTDPQQQIVWLHEQWRRVDRWVREHQDSDLTQLLAG